jgi:D-alanyl-D-alanine carboxypeptidase
MPMQIMGCCRSLPRKRKKTGFAEILATRIFEPCNLKNTYYGNLADSIGDEAKSYYYASGWQAIEPGDLSLAAGAGAIVSTPTDLNTFLFHLFSGKLLPPSSLAHMKAIEDGYGSGMMQVHYYDQVAFSHAGQIDGFQARSTFFVADNVAISYCFNGVAMPLDKVLIAVLGIYYKK